MKKKCFFAVIAIILIICIVKLKYNKDKIEKSYDGNFMNMGLVVQDDENIYYNKYPEGIYKVSGNSEELITDDLAYSIHIKEDWIYYLTIGDSYKVNIVKIKKTGEDRQILFTFNSTYTRTYVIDNNIFFSNNIDGKNVVSKIDINGNDNKILVNDEIHNFQVTDKHIYYTDKNNTIYRTDLEGKKKERISEMSSANNFQVSDNSIYYIGSKSNRLEKINLSNLKNSLVTNAIMSEPFNVVGNMIYYFDLNTRAICSFNMTNSEIKEIVKLEGNNTFINVLNNDIYYLDNLEMHKIQVK